MKAQPLPKNIVSLAKSKGIEKFTLQFSGGSDEGYLNVDTDGYDREFNSHVEEWAWNVYSYNGAGEGQDYGDDITYDLKNNTVTTQEWSTHRAYDKPFDAKLELAEDFDFI